MFNFKLIMNIFFNIIYIYIQYTVQIPSNTGNGESKTNLTIAKVNIIAPDKQFPILRTLPVLI
jgi:hypothetical protein